MRIFIAGARSIAELPLLVQQRLFSIYQKNFDVIVGDCYGVDTSVQRFYAGLNYHNLTIYASNGKARNNIGNWKIQSVVAPENMRGFDFYKQKDIAMSNDADFGFMIWDGESRGTLSNIVNLVTENKTVLVYLTVAEKMIVVKCFDDLNNLISLCPDKTKKLYRSLTVPAKVESIQLRLI